MEERERNSRLSPEIYVYATNKNFLNLYDALRIDKVKMEIAGYDSASNRQTGLASAWLDVDDVRVITHLCTHRLFAAVTGGKWEKYGGSQREDGHMESRTLAIEWDEGENGRFSRYPYRISIANGPGKRTATGGVSPDGAPTSQMSMRLPELDMIKAMLALSDYLRAYESAHHHRIVADRVRELRDKLADRGERHAEEPERITPRIAERAPQLAASRPPQPTGSRPAQPGAPATLQAIEGGARRPNPRQQSVPTQIRTRSAG